MPQGAKKKKHIHTHEHGGWRKGAGRPVDIRGKWLRGLLTPEQEFLYEPVVIKLLRHGQHRPVKVNRLDIAVHCFEQYWRRTGTEAVASRLDTLDWYKEQYKTGHMPAEKYLNQVYKHLGYFYERDPILRGMLKEVVVSPKPKLQKSLRETISDLRKDIVGLTTKEKPKPDPDQIHQKQDGECDQWGRRIIPEAEWKAKNGAALSRYIANKEKPEEPFGYGYERG